MREIFEGFNEMNEKISKGFKSIEEEMFGINLKDKGLKAGVEMFVIAKMLEKVMEQWEESVEEKQKKFTNEEAIKASKPSPCAFDECAKKLNKERERQQKEEIDRLKEVRKLRKENEELKREVDELRTVIKIGLKQGFIDSSLALKYPNGREDS